MFNASACRPATRMTPKSKSEYGESVRDFMKKFIPKSATVSTWDAFCRFVKALMAFCLVPLPELDNAWSQVNADLPAISQPARDRLIRFRDYFNRTWMENSSYPREIWNHYGYGEIVDLSQHSYILTKSHLVFPNNVIFLRSVSRTLQELRHSYDKPPGRLAQRPQPPGEENAL